MLIWDSISVDFASSTIHYKNSQYLKFDLLDSAGFWQVMLPEAIAIVMAPTDTSRLVWGGIGEENCTKIRDAVALICEEYYNHSHFSATDTHK